MNGNNPIFDHFNEYFDHLLNTQQVNTYKFTIRYKDGKESQPIIKHFSLNQAKENLKKWFPGCKAIVECRELFYDKDVR